MTKCPTCKAKSKWPSGRCNRCEKRVRTVKSRRQEGLCPKCGTFPPEGKFIECANCRAQYREQRTKRFEERIANKVCTWCGLQQAKVHHVKQSFCEECWFKQQAARHGVSSELLLVLWTGQRGVCAYSGELMLLGGRSPTSASLDHKIPSKRKGGNEKTNLHWVTRKMNLMKSNLTHEEFVTLCSRVHFQYASVS